MRSLIVFLFAIFLLVACSDLSHEDPETIIAAWGGISSTEGTSTATGTSSASATLGTPGTPVEYGGQTYKTVVIGNQTWMAENLNYATASGSYCDANTANYCATYGRVYDWATAQTVCPSGWHLPTDPEWQTLEKNLGMSDANAGTAEWRGTDEGWKMKANSSLWSSNNGTTNTSGFSALPGGSYFGGSFYGVGIQAFFWTATESGTNNAWYRELNVGYANVNRNNDAKPDGFSVRCLQGSN